MKILLTGGTGRLGKEIVKLNPDVYAPTRNEMNILDYKRTREIVKTFDPDVIIHCGAYTDVLRAEKEQALCWNTNVIATKNLLVSTYYLRHPTHFTYLSSACIFRGDRGNYCENDVPYPSNFYGLTKLMGENTVAHSLKPWLVIRTNFVSRGPWQYERAFTDRYGTYLYADEVAKRVLELVQARVTGIVHVCGEEKLSLFELAKRTSPDVKPYTLAEFYAEHPDAAALTRDMSLRSICATEKHISAEQ